MRSQDAKSAGDIDSKTTTTNDIPLIKTENKASKVESGGPSTGEESHQKKETQEAKGELITQNNASEKPVKKSNPRAKNDPRKKPKPVTDVEVSTAELKTEPKQATLVAEQNDNPPVNKAARALNDPRKKRKNTETKDNNNN